MSLEYNKKMIPRAKELRKPMTRQERHLWYDFLKDYSPCFQRQKTIGSYIVDFYCHEAALVIELDGSQHYEARAKAYDDERTRFLEAAGLEVLRFTNASVDRDFAGVCMMIERFVHMRRERA
ncbi:MAG: endonuclease domain-containing protein [Clostridia bacterium]|nr:endonuclease domain-containing protein [Clostridia bacterium]